jgi:hypothetical protein
VSYITVYGQKIDRYYLGQHYVCAHCGAEITIDGNWCRGDGRHRISGENDVDSKPYRPPEHKPKTEGKLVIDRGTIPYSVVANDYECNRCGGRLRESDGFLVCDGPERHLIATGDDVCKRKFYVPREIQELLDAEDFLYGLERWAGICNFEQGARETMARLKDQKTISGGLTRAGKIRLGYKVPIKDDQGRQKVYQYGKMKGQLMWRAVNVDYFVLHDAPAVAAAYMPNEDAGYDGHPSVIGDQYGSGPTQLSVFLPFSDPERCFEARYEWRKGKVVYCIGDGESVKYALSEDGIEALVKGGRATRDWKDEQWNMERGQRVACSGVFQNYWPTRCDKCTAADGTAAQYLRVVVRDPREPGNLHRVVGDELAYYQISTKSVVGYDRLAEQIDFIAEQARRASAPLMGIPLRLSRVPTEMTYVHEDRQTKEKSRRSVTHAILNIEPDPDWVKPMAMLAYQQATMAAPLELPAGTTPESWGEDIEDENGGGGVVDVVDGEFTEGAGEGEPSGGEPAGNSKSPTWSNPNHWYVANATAREKFDGWLQNELQLVVVKLLKGLQFADLTGLSTDMKNAKTQVETWYNAKLKALSGNWLTHDAVSVVMKEEQLVPNGGAHEAAELLAKAELAGVLDEVEITDTDGIVAAVCAWKGIATQPALFEDEAA